MFSKLRGNIAVETLPAFLRKREEGREKGGEVTWEERKKIKRKRIVFVLKKRQKEIVRYTFFGGKQFH